MSDIAKLKVVLDPAGRGSVSLNDMPLDCVTAVEFRSSAGQLTEIKLTMFAELDADVTAKLEQIALAKVETEGSPQQTVRCADGRELRVRHGAK